MIKIADRFNITSIVKDYFSSVIAFDIKHCDRKECHQCFNSFIFALINGLDVSKCQVFFANLKKVKISENLSETVLPYVDKLCRREAISWNGSCEGGPANAPKIYNLISLLLFCNWKMFLSIFLFCSFFSFHTLLSFSFVVIAKNLHIICRSNGLFNRWTPCSYHFR